MSTGSQLAEPVLDWCSWRRAAGAPAVAEAHAPLPNLGVRMYFLRLVEQQTVPVGTRARSALDSQFAVANVRTTSRTGTLHASAPSDQPLSPLSLCSTRSPEQARSPGAKRVISAPTCPATLGHTTSVGPDPLLSSGSDMNIAIRLHRLPRPGSSSRIPPIPRSPSIRAPVAALLERERARTAIPAGVGERRKAAAPRPPCRHRSSVSSRNTSPSSSPPRRSRAPTLHAPGRPSPRPRRRFSRKRSAFCTSDCRKACHLPPTRDERILRPSRAPRPPRRSASCRRSASLQSNRASSDVASSPTRARGRIARLVAFRFTRSVLARLQPRRPAAAPAPRAPRASASHRAGRTAPDPDRAPPPPARRSSNTMPPSREQRLDVGEPADQRPRGSLARRNANTSSPPSPDSSVAGRLSVGSSDACSHTSSDSPSALALVEMETRASSGEPCRAASSPVVDPLRHSFARAPSSRCAPAAPATAREPFEESSIAERVRRAVFVSRTRPRATARARCDRRRYG